MPTTYAIAELRPDEPGGFSPRGAVKRLWQSREFETIVAGPAETGKTFGALHYLDALLWKYAGAHAVMIRKTYASLVGSALRTYLRILGPSSPVVPYGGEKPQWFDYPNGSRLWVAGFDNPGKSLSSERDFAFVNQAEELALADWETLTTRCTGRASVAPYTRVFGDCNPGAPTHWIKAREREGSLRLLESRHEDNPTLFDDDGRITDQGRKTLAILDSLTGVRRERLRFGRWVQAEGVVYEGWDDAIHLIEPFAVPGAWKRYWAIDFGFTNPFSLLDVRVDGDGRMYVVREIYRTQTLVEDHARRALEMYGVPTVRRLDPSGRVEVVADWSRSREPMPVAVVCDHDAEGRATFEKHAGVRTTPAAKHIGIETGIQAVAARLRRAGDGRPRLYVFKNATIEVDSRLVEEHKPTGLVDEMAVYSRGKNYGPPKKSDGGPRDELPIDKDNHSCDGLRYVTTFIDGHTTRPRAGAI